MVGILKRFFGLSTSQDTRKTETVREQPRRKPQPELEPENIPLPDFSLPGHSYFTQLEKLTSSISARNYSAAAEAARASLPMLRDWLKDSRGDGQRLDIRIPALSQGGTMMAITGDKEGLFELSKLVEDFDPLSAYREEAEEHLADLDLFNRIRRLIRSNPGVLQNQIKALLGIDDGRRASRLVAYLEKSGEVRRAKNGKTFNLYKAGEEIPDIATETIYTEPDKPGSHRLETRAVSPRVLDPERVRIVPLPPSLKSPSKTQKVPGMR